MRVHGRTVGEVGEVGEASEVGGAEHNQQFYHRTPTD